MAETSGGEPWRRCANCKAPIGLGAKYWICSVSTCQRARGPQFCKPECWAVHNEIENHRDGWCVEKRAPTVAEAPAPKASASSASSASSAGPKEPRDGGGGDVLVVVSRLKALVREASDGFSTSDGVLPILSDALRHLADQAIENARRAGRKTVLARDVPRSGPKGGRDGEALVVVSRLKAYIQEKADLRTSDDVVPLFSEEVRRLMRLAIEACKAHGRVTVLERDMPRPDAVVRR